MRLRGITLIAAAAGRIASGDSGVRLKDLVKIEGVRSNQLVGYGIVVGLAGTGDSQQTLFSAQSLTNVLLRMGVSVNPALIMVKNTAAVMVTATLPPYAQPGSTIDATVGAVGDARNLQGVADEQRNRDVRTLEQAVNRRQHDVEADQAPGWDEIGREQRAIEGTEPPVFEHVTLHRHPAPLARAPLPVFNELTR